MKPDRRNFNRAALASTIGVLGAGSQTFAHASTCPTSADKSEEPRAQPEFCAFVKFVQQLSFENLAETLARFGYQGIEATIRPKGIVLPENAKKELPRLVNALRKNDLDITVMATAVNSADDKQGVELLKVAADLGIKRYRTNYYRYDLSKPLYPQIDKFRRQAEKLAELNARLGITGLCQNHVGARNVGSTVWDFLVLLKDINPDHLGVAFDIRHATACGGQSWSVLWDVIKPHTRAIFVKDFRWNGLKPVSTQLGEGLVEKKFFQMLRKDKLGLPMSVHIEYLQKAGLDKNVEALETDLKTLKQLLNA